MFWPHARMCVVCIPVGSPCRFWESHLSLLQERWVLLTSKPSFLLPASRWARALLDTKPSHEEWMQINPLSLELLLMKSLTVRMRPTSLRASFSALVVKWLPWSRRMQCVMVSWYIRYPLNSRRGAGMRKVNHIQTTQQGQSPASSADNKVWCHQLAGLWGACPLLQWCCHIKAEVGLCSQHTEHPGGAGTRLCVWKGLHY